MSPITPLSRYAGNDGDYDHYADDDEDDFFAAAAAANENYDYGNVDGDDSDNAVDDRWLCSFDEYYDDDHFGMQVGCLLAVVAFADAQSPNLKMEQFFSTMTTPQARIDHCWIYIYTLK